MTEKRASYRQRSLDSNHQEMEKSQQNRTRAKTENQKNKTYTREATCSIRQMDGEGNERKFILSFSSEEPYDRGWCIEILDHSPGAVDLKRLEEIGVLLFNHKRDVVLGKINRVWIEDNRGQAEVEFDTDEQAEVIYQKVKSGTLKGVSVGYRINSIEEIAPNKTSNDGKFNGPCDVVRSWEPFEISIVSVPADPSVGVGREYEEPAINTERSAPTIQERQLQINKNLQ